MTSTYLSYQVIVRDLQRSLRQTAAEPQVAREAEYYKVNIGKVKSVDAFLKNDRLYNYAMTAHGMKDMIPSKAFMRKVLESDLSDQRSFARTLVDTRFQVFARAFSFMTDGTVAPTAELAQTEAQEGDTVGLYSEHRVRKGETAAVEAENYRDRIGIMASVDDFLRDDRLFAFALTAHGLDPKIASTTTIRNVLTSDLDDPESVANKLGGSYVALAAAFDFGADGTLPAGFSAQSATSVDETVYRYYEASGNGASPAAAAFKTELYGAGIATLTSVDDLLGDDELYTYALIAHGIDPTLVTKSDMRQVLTSDLDDPGSFANTLADPRFKALAAAFNFAPDGTIAGTDGAQSTAQLEATIDLYFTHYDDKAVDTDAIATTYYRNRIGAVASVGALLADSKLYTYLLEAHGLDPSVESKATIARVLESDVTDPKSFANTLRDDRYRNLAAAVNFAKGGKVTTAHEAQLDRDELAIIQLHNGRVGTTKVEQDKAKAEVAYYHDTIDTVSSLDAFLKDKRLVAFVLKAYGLEGEKLDDATLRKVLTSDPFDKASFVNKQADARLRDLAASFNFTADGKVSRLPQGTAQSRRDQLATADLYLNQTLESEAGAQSEGVRLALYFRRKAPTIRTAFNLLADKALLEVTRTALSLPASFSQLDIDVQARLIGKRIKFADLQDPRKLDRFLAQFATLYDQANSASSASSAASILIGGQVPTGIGDGLLASLQNVRTGRI